MKRSEDTLSQIRLLIADDHEMVRKGIRSWFEAEEDIVVVGEAMRGREIASMIEECKPDVLMLDLHFPDKHGVEVIRDLRAAANTIPILVMTGYEKQRARSVLEAGANGFLNKEESRARLIEAVRWAARGETGKWISPSIAQEVLESNVAMEQAGLTKTELKVLSLIEKKSTEIANALFLGEGTVKNHITSIYSKLGVTSRIEAAAWAKKHGIL